jgi:hypothetical protein
MHEGKAMLRTMSKLVVVVFFPLTFAGCSSLPVVTYNTFDPSTKVDPAKIDTVPNTYELWTTALEFAKDSGGLMNASVSAAPVNVGPTTLSIVGEAHWYKTTAVTLTTASDSNLLSSVSVNVTDNRASYITTAAELIGTVLAVAGVALAPDPGAELPCGPLLPTTLPTPDSVMAFDEVINVFDALKLTEQNSKCPVDGSTRFAVGNTKDGVGTLAVVTVGKPPASAIDLTSSLGTLMTSAKSVFLFPACRSASVEYMGTGAITTKTADGKPDTSKALYRKVKFLFSDPRYVQAIPLPVQGTLTVKPQCGMTAGKDSGTPDATPAIVKALADAAQSISGKGSSGSAKSTGKTNGSGT